MENNNNKKNTVRKKMSLRDYVNLMNYFQTGELEMDLTEYDPKVLARVETRTMRFSKADKDKMDEFFSRNPFGISVKSVLDTVPKIKSKTSLLPNLQVVEPGPVDGGSADCLQEIAQVSKVQIKIPDGDTPWIVDKNKGISPDNIDISILAKMTEQGLMNEATFKDIIGDGNDADKIWGCDVSDYYGSDKLDKKYSADVILPFVFTTAERQYKYLVEIMNEEEPSPEETLDRYRMYILNMHGIPVQDYSDKIYGFEEATTISDNKIVFDDDNDETYTYNSADDMEHDVLYLAVHKKIGYDVAIDIFNKKTTVNKIIKKIYDKHPQGLPGKSKFYHTRLEAYEDGALEL